MRIRTLALAIALAVGTAGQLVAQQPTGAASAPGTPAAPAKTGKAEITGVVVDSLHGRYLQGAEVMIQGMEATLLTDSAGRFTISGLTPGTYQVGVFHPVLDTLGLSLATKPFHAGPDSTTIAVLAVPSAATIIHGACKTPVAGTGNSAVIGHVNDPETLQPVAGAEVSLAWTEIQVSKEVGIRRTPHVVRDTTDQLGSFDLCGLPASMAASLQARKGTAVTSEIPIALGENPTELFVRTLLLSSANPAEKTGNASVSGTVVLEGSPPNAQSRVELVGTDVVVMTNQSGEFTMTNLPSGSHVLLARHLGYAAATAPVDLTARAPQKVTIKLPKFVAIMDPVLVTARRSASLDKVGFSQRRKSGSGQYIGPEQIEKMHPIYLNDIFRRFPGIRVNYSGSRQTLSSSRGTSTLNGGSCVEFFLDGAPWLSATPGDINDFVTGDEVVAVEVYQGANTPAEFTRGLGGCLTVVVWTKFRMREVTDK